MAADKKKKGQGSGKTKILLAVLVGMVLVLTGLYYHKTGALPIVEGEVTHFLKVWEWIR